MRATTWRFSRHGVGAAFLLSWARALRLAGKRQILFAGDSTLRYQYELLCRGDRRRLRKLDSYWACTFTDDVDLLYVDYLKSTHKLVRSGPDGAVGLIEQAVGRPPEVVYMNAYSLWMLHLEPVLRWYAWAGRRANYTAGWLAGSMRRVLGRGARAVVFMGSHSVCERSFYGAWRDALAKPGGIEAGCGRYVTDGCPGLAMELACDDGMRRLCRKSALTRKSSHRLAREEYAAVAACQADGLRVGLVDAHQITDKAGCDHTQDGRHYDPETLWQELKALDMTLGQLRVEPVAFGSDGDVTNAARIGGRDAGTAPSGAKAAGVVGEATGAAGSGPEAVRASSSSGGGVAEAAGNGIGATSADGQ